MSRRLRYLLHFGAAWLLLYGAVAMPVMWQAPQGTLGYLVVNWTTLWALTGLALAPAFFLLGGVKGDQERGSLVWILVAGVASALAALGLEYGMKIVGFSFAYAPYGMTAALLIIAMICYLATRLIPAADFVHWGLLIAGILVAAAVLVPNFVRTSCGSQISACKSNLRNIGTALEMYSTDNGGVYATDLAQLTPNYLKTIPTCPSAGADTYSMSFVSVSKPDAYTVFCAGVNHASASVPADFPMYTSTQGLISQPEGPENPASPGYPQVDYARRLYLEPWFVVVQVLVGLVGFLCLYEAREKRGYPWYFGVASVCFALIPWNLLLPSPQVANDYNHCVQNLIRMREWTRQYRAAHGGKSPATLANLAPRAVPTCPAAGTATYTYQVDHDGHFIIFCSGQHHGGMYPGCAADYPRYIESRNTILRHP